MTKDEVEQTSNEPPKPPTAQEQSEKPQQAPTSDSKPAPAPTQSKGPNDKANRSEYLIREDFVKSHREAKELARIMRSKGYYAKVAEVDGGYKVYTYDYPNRAKRGQGKPSKLVILPKSSASKTVPLSKPTSFDINPSMGGLDFNPNLKALEKFEFNADALNLNTSSLNSLDFDMNFDMNLGVDFSKLEFDLFGGGNVGKAKRKKR